jgi:cell division topological specificity factor
MLMLDFINKLFGRDADANSKDVAKERLRLVLVHDRASISPHLLETLKEELIAVINKYMEIDEDTFNVKLDRSDDSVALIANIPVRRMKRDLDAPKNGH